MNEIFTIIAISALAFVLLVLFDKRSFVVAFFKKIFIKPKKLKIPKTQDLPKIDTDEIPLTENLELGKPFSFNKVEDEKEEEVFDVGNLFSNKDSESKDEEIDIDDLIMKMRQDENKRVDQQNLAEFFDFDTQDFKNMSMEEMDNIIESKLIDSKDKNDYIPQNLTGEELGQYIKKLPLEIKIMLLGDVLKKK